jgi:hypothetical protein
VKIEERLDQLSAKSNGPFTPIEREQAFEVIARYAVKLLRQFERTPIVIGPPGLCDWNKAFLNTCEIPKE